MLTLSNINENTLLNKIVSIEIDKMQKKNNEQRPTFPFTSIIGQEEIFAL